MFTLINLKIYLKLRYCKDTISSLNPSNVSIWLSRRWRICKLTNDEIPSKDLIRLVGWNLIVTLDHISEAVHFASLLKRTPNSAMQNKNLISETSADQVKFPDVRWINSCCTLQPICSQIQHTKVSHFHWVEATDFLNLIV